jgi:orotidine-5'-phosphate decarboxylase
VHAADRLDESIGRTGSIACVGLDPRPSLLPPALRTRAADEHGPGPAGVAAAFTEFNAAIIDAVAGRCAAVKPQVACYEAYGSAGWAALEATVAHAAAAGIPVVLDAKRADIDTTAAHYGQMAFGGAPGLDDEPVDGIGASWITVNPYLGADGVLPILGERSCGAFVLVKTSNASSADVQDVAVDLGRTGSDTVAELVAELVRAWGEERMADCGLSDVGAVVGATYPDHARALRARMPDAIFLVPGYGAQGGGAADALAGARPDGRGVLISSSRAICGAWQADGTDDWASAARGALDAMNADLETARR